MAGIRSLHHHARLLLAPDDEEVERLTTTLAERMTKLLQRRGLGPDSDPAESDPLSRDQPWLAGLYAAAVSGKVAFGPNAGRRVTRTGDQIDPESMEALASPRCASVCGFSLHANTAVPAGDRTRLERLCRYCARPPIAIERLEPLSDGRVTGTITWPLRPLYASVSSRPFYASSECELTSAINLTVCGVG